MSIQTWEEEFYRISAEQVSHGNAVEHSLRKWEGLRRENLAKHQVAICNQAKIIDINSNIGGRYDCIYIDGDSCALCHHYADKATNCEHCPLAIVRNGTPCDRMMSEEDESPYEEFMQHANPEPMIEWLKKAKDYEANHG